MGQQSLRACNAFCRGTAQGAAEATRGEQQRWIKQGGKSAQEWGSGTHLLRAADDFLCCPSASLRQQWGSCEQASAQQELPPVCHGAAAPAAPLPCSHCACSTSGDKASLTLPALAGPAGRLERLKRLDSAGHGARTQLLSCLADSQTGRDCCSVFSGRSDPIWLIPGPARAECQGPILQQAASLSLFATSRRPPSHPAPALLRLPALPSSSSQLQCLTHRFLVFRCVERLWEVGCEPAAHH